VHLTVVGAGPAYSDSAGAVGACYLVRSGARALALDLGHGAFAGLASRFPPERLETVVISHLHPDHFVDLVPLRHYLQHHLHPPRRVRVDAHRDLAGRIDALHAEPGFTATTLDVVPLDVGLRTVGPFTIEAVRVTHTPDSFAVRVTDAPDAPGVVYSGDLGVASDLKPLIRAGDTLLTEVSFGPGPVPAGALHLAGPAVGALAEAARPGQVLLTHLLMGRDVDATVDSVRSRFRGPVGVVALGDELPI